MKENKTMDTEATYSRTCFECNGERITDVIISHNSTVLYDGSTYKIDYVEVPVRKCVTCEHITFNKNSSAVMDIQTRKVIGLLQVSEINEIVLSSGLSLSEFSIKLGFSFEGRLSQALSYLGIQTRTEDTILRQFRLDQGNLKSGKHILGVHDFSNQQELIESAKVLIDEKYSERGERTGELLRSLVEALENIRDAKSDAAKLVSLEDNAKE